MENDIMQIIAFAGNARSLALKSICAAKTGGEPEAASQLWQAQQDLKIAQKAHQRMLCEGATNELTFSLFLLHGEDHLMGALTTIDLAKELIDLYAMQNQLQQTLEKLKKGESI